MRLYIDYKRLNTITIKNRHSLSLIIKTLNRLYSVNVFIKLDLKNIYYKIRIKINNKWKIIFRTRYNYFKYLIIFFKLINAPTIFQVYINKTLKNLVDVTCVIYLNNILIYNINSAKY